MRIDATCLSDGSSEWRLRDLLAGVERAAIEGTEERGEIGVTANAAEAAPGLEQPGGNPAYEHVPIPPAPHVADETPTRPLFSFLSIHASAPGDWLAVTPGTFSSSARHLAPRQVAMNPASSGAN